MVTSKAFGFLDLIYKKDAFASSNHQLGFVWKYKCLPALAALILEGIVQVKEQIEVLGSYRGAATLAEFLI